jgi:hypothetical protein
MSALGQERTFRHSCDHLVDADNPAQVWLGGIV